MDVPDIAGTGRYVIHEASMDLLTDKEKIVLVLIMMQQLFQFRGQEESHQIYRKSMTRVI